MIFAVAAPAVLALAARPGASSSGRPPHRCEPGLRIRARHAPLSGAARYVRLSRRLSTLRADRILERVRDLCCAWRAPRAWIRRAGSRAGRTCACCREPRASAANALLHVLTRCLDSAGDRARGSDVLDPQRLAHHGDTGGRALAGARGLGRVAVVRADEHRGPSGDCNATGTDSRSSSCCSRSGRRAARRPSGSSRGGWTSRGRRGSRTRPRLSSSWLRASPRSSSATAARPRSLTGRTTPSPPPRPRSPATSTPGSSTSRAEAATSSGGTPGRCTGSGRGSVTVPVATSSTGTCTGPFPERSRTRTASTWSRSPSWGRSVSVCLSWRSAFRSWRP